MPSTTGSTASRWLGFAARVTPIVRPDAAVYLPLAAEVVLHVAAATGHVRIELALELTEDL